jgi:hypothetical protein
MRIFSAQDLCVSVEDVDFLNPGRPEDGRECGVRLELRIVEPDADPGSIYVSRALSIGRAVCRVDLLESAPHAQDRMHWHPRMVNGEPNGRVFDEQLRADPLRWLGERLRDGLGTLERAGVDEPARYAGSCRALAQLTEMIVADAAAGLDRSRRGPWPSVQRDERGMALTG